MSRTHAHRPFHVRELHDYGVPVYGGPRQNPDDPWTWTPGAMGDGIPRREIRKYLGNHPGDRAAAKQQRKAMRRKRHQQDHLLTRDPLRYEDMTRTVEKIDQWALPSW